MKNLKAIRKYNRLTLKQLSKHTNITVASLSNLERGVCTAQIETRRKIEHYFDEKINWLDTPYIDSEPRGFEVTFTDAERSFRSLVHEITSLNNVQKNSFCEAAIQHLKRLQFDG